MMMTDSTESNGLLHAYLLDGTGGAVQVDWHSVAKWSPEQGCLWLHLNYLEEGVSGWLRRESGISELAVSALLSEETRPRTQNVRGELLLALRGVNLNPGADPEDMVSIRLWSDGTRIISTRHRPILSATDVRKRLDAGNGARNAEELIVDLIAHIVMRMSDTVDKLEDEALELEEHMLSSTPAEVRSKLTLLRKQTIAIRRYLAPQREALNRLVMEKFVWISESNQLNLREINDGLIRHIEDIDAVRERAALVQEELQGRISEQSNQRMYVLSIVAAIFLPLGFFTGLMGINVGGMPGVDDDGAFWMVVAMCVVSIAFVAGIFRWKKWL